ncbi:MAG: hypothetical protein EAZ90_05370 [Oscillatoriales cyanobacterium]|nr:MAG: hypothetical protein EAZ94_01520 [Oscillatoriales cyanobacterium]TAE28083.1 MAG: hypothetical protein EAZ93_04875 [Oscillatoriales cyanobacterium]TAE44612.1 MAG: hypothetical protein EAZ90_05370 [Oscillatoriales cyanobacterium]TAF84124.1 MAG: hypothetical protein EAZ49_30810 [Oscillatoriales cyanobacterium]TAG59653.1 MAG: hypothetical protein EAZ28_10605 [Oscillatoriales cyanobacterium]
MTVEERPLPLSPRIGIINSLILIPPDRAFNQFFLVKVFLINFSGDDLSIVPQQSFLWDDDLENRPRKNDCCGMGRKASPNYFCNLVCWIETQLKTFEFNRNFWSCFYRWSEKIVEFG